MEHVLSLWGRLQPQLNLWIEHAEPWFGHASEVWKLHSPAISALTSALVLVLGISRLSAGRSKRRLSQDLGRLKAEMADLQEKYDKEVYWRMADEKYKSTAGRSTLAA
jgi:hypothetical protein